MRALATLSGPNRDIVARHLVMAGQLIDLDPEAAYQHAQAAVSRAGRVDVVREAAALTAYASGRYEEALREVRAVRRMRGDDSLRAVEADAERGLGHTRRPLRSSTQPTPRLWILRNRSNWCSSPLVHVLTSVSPTSAS